MKTTNTMTIKQFRSTVASELEDLLDEWCQITDAKGHPLWQIKRNYVFSPRLPRWRMTDFNRMRIGDTRTALAQARPVPGVAVLTVRGADVFLIRLKGVDDES